MAAGKFVALMVMCLVFVAAVEVPLASADAFGDCFKACHSECTDNGRGPTFCEMKCDTDCFNKDIAARLNLKAP